jgi:hypothetical protein
MNQRITFGNRITLNYKPVRGLGLREVLLLGAATAQAVYFIFIADQINFTLRLSVALVLALALLAIALVPVRGHRVEHFAFIVLRGLLRPRRYLHQTAERDQPDVVAPPAGSELGARPVRVRAPARAPASVWEGDWVAPNLAPVMALFCAMLVVGSLMVFASGGHLPGVPW